LNYCASDSWRRFWHQKPLLLCLNGLQTKLQPGAETLILRLRS
jgi:hypothetical protein